MWSCTAVQDAGTPLDRTTDALEAGSTCRGNAWVAEEAVVGSTDSRTRTARTRRTAADTGTQGPDPSLVEVVRYFRKIPRLLLMLLSPETNKNVRR